MAIYQAPRTAGSCLLLKDTATAASVISKPFPVMAGKPHRLELQYISSSTTGANTVKIQIRWLDSSQTTLSTQTIHDTAATAADTWEYVRRLVWPPEDACYARIILAKGAAAAYNLAFDRIEFERTQDTTDKSSCSIVLADDFIKYSSGAAPWGDLGWEEFSIAGTVQYSKVAPAAATFNSWSEAGVMRIEAPDTSGQGGGLNLTPLTSAPFYGRPPAGAMCRIKLNIPSVNVNATYYAGIWSSITVYPDGALANAISGIGFVARPGAVAANWYGVVRNGTSESTVDLGVTADSTWRTLGWARTLTGVQFFVGDDPTGSAVTTNLPATTATMTPILGVVTNAGAGFTRKFDIDRFDLECFMNRR